MPCPRLWPGHSERVALTHSSTSWTVRGSAKSRFWMPEPMERAAMKVRGSWATFIMADMCGKSSTVRAMCSSAYMSSGHDAPQAEVRPAGKQR